MNWEIIRTYYIAQVILLYLLIGWKWSPLVAQLIKNMSAKQETTCDVRDMTLISG